MNAGRRKLLLEALGQDEKILWSGQPVPRFFSPLTTGCMVFGVAWICTIGLILAGSGAELAAWSTGAKAVVALFFTLFFLIGLLFACAPLLLYLRLKNTACAITGDRVIRVTCFPRPLVTSCSLEAVSEIRFTENHDNTGDVTLVQGMRVSAEDTLFFEHIRQAQEVARLVESRVAKLLKNESTAETADAPQKPLLKEDLSSREVMAETAQRLPAAGLMLLAGGFLVIGLPSLLSRYTPLAFPVCYFLLFLVLLLLQLRTILLAGRSVRWPTTFGVVAESSIRKEGGGDDPDLYVPRIRYTYTVNGKAYQGDQVTTRQRADTSSRARAAEIVARYPEGRPVTVYYRPGKPDCAVLEPGRGAGNWIVFLLLLAACLASAVWIVFTL